MTSERQESTHEAQVADVPEDDFTWHGLVERAMRTARSGMPDSAAELRLLQVVRGAMASGFDHALLAGTSAEAYAYVMTLLSEGERDRT